jgi:hypothetical protein
MSLTTQRIVPDIKKLKEQLHVALNIDGKNGLKTLFQVLPKEQSHKNEVQWHKAYVGGAFAIALLSGLAYKQFRNIYATTGLLTAAAVLAYFKSRVSVEVPTQEYSEQCDKIKEVFEGVAEALRQTWQITSDVFARKVNDEIGKGEQDVEKLIALNKKLYETYFYKPATVSLYSDKGKDLVTDEEKPWREVFQRLHPLAKNLSEVELEKIKEGLHPVVLKQLENLKNEATRMVNGNLPIPNNYVDIKGIGDEKNGKLIAQAWPAPALKV